MANPVLLSLRASVSVDTEGEHRQAAAMGLDGQVVRRAKEAREDRVIIPVRAVAFGL
jgi:hypothetical protein